MTVTVVKTGQIGDFVVRDIPSQPGAFGMSLKSSKGLVNYLIERSFTEYVVVVPLTT
jgi:hypothetical protein